MTNQQAQRTAETPSGIGIAYAFVAGLVVAAVTIWVGWGAETNREFTGAFLGAGFAMLLLLEAFGGWVKRSEAAMVARRQALEQEMEARVHDPDFPRQYKPGPY